MSVRVKATTSFVGHYGPDRSTIVAHAGMEFDLPEGVDWLRVGLVEEITEKPAQASGKAEEARRKPKEKAVTK